MIPRRDLDISIKYDNHEICSHSRGRIEKQWQNDNRYCHTLYSYWSTHHVYHWLRCSWWIMETCFCLSRQVSLLHGSEIECLKPRPGISLMTCPVSHHSRSWWCWGCWCAGWIGVTSILFYALSWASTLTDLHLILPISRLVFPCRLLSGCNLNAKSDEI